jgi:hypothetical protein
MVVVGITTKNHLLPLAFALVEGENNDSWSWFLTLVRKNIFKATLPLYTDGVHIILPQTFGRSNGAKKLLKG